jgi:uncharacterized protein
MLVQAVPFEPPVYSLRNGHLQTIIPGLFRKIDLRYKRERLNLPDGDFLDIDWAVQNKSTPNHKLAIVLHGLEGNSTRHYVTGMIRSLQQLGFDGLAVNFRGCSGEMNRLPRFYHHGDTPDIDFVLRHIMHTKPSYTAVVLVGFSMGGNMTLKYVGESGLYLPKILKKALALSVPCDISSCSDELTKPQKWIYTKNFLLTLGKKLTEKSKIMPQQIDVKDYDKIYNFRDFDNRYTAPLHGFADAEDYYQKVSSRYYVSGIKIPTLLINALDDPFLTPKCFPTEIAEKHNYFHFESPIFGGHVGFEMRNDTLSYAEKRALAWFADVV